MCEHVYLTCVEVYNITSLEQSVAKFVLSQVLCLFHGVACQNIVSY